MSEVVPRPPLDPPPSSYPRRHRYEGGLAMLRWIKAAVKQGYSLEDLHGAYGVDVMQIVGQAPMLYRIAWQLGLIDEALPAQLYDPKGRHLVD